MVKVKLLSSGIKISRNNDKIEVERNIFIMDIFIIERKQSGEVTFSLLHQDSSILKEVMFVLRSLFAILRL